MSRMPVDVDLAGALDLALEDALDEIVLAHLAGVVDLEVGADLDELLEVLALEFVDVHRHLVRPYGGSANGRAGMVGLRPGMAPRNRDARAQNVWRGPSRRHAAAASGKVRGATQIIALRGIRSSVSAFQLRGAHTHNLLRRLASRFGGRQSRLRRCQRILRGSEIVGASRNLRESGVRRRHRSCQRVLRGLEIVGGRREERESIVRGLLLPLPARPARP